MDKKKLLKLSMVVLLVLAIVYYLVKLLSKPTAIPEYSALPIKLARAVAEENLYTFEDWRGPTLEEWYTFYDLKKEPTAYLFNVSDYYGKAGYITISARFEIAPIVDISNSVDTPVTKIIKLTNDIAIGTIYDPNDVKSDYLYLGGTDYYVKLTLREGSSVMVKYYRIRGEQVDEVEEEHVLSKQETLATSREEGAAEKWAEIIRRYY